MDNKIDLPQWAACEWARSRNRRTLRARQPRQCKQTYHSGRAFARTIVSQPSHSRKRSLTRMVGKRRGQIMTIARLIGSCIFAITCAFATPGFAQVSVKVGMLLPTNGPFTSTGKQLVAAARLNLQLKGVRKPVRASDT